MSLFHVQSTDIHKPQLFNRFDDCVVGGESLIVDLFKVATEFRQTNPEEFKTMCTVPATFQKIHYGRSVHRL